VVFIDESGFRLLPMVVRTWAVRGQTPTLRAPLSWGHLAVIGALTDEGKLYTQVQRRGFRATDIIRFLRYLLRCLPGKLLLIWDGLPAHRSKRVKAFVAQESNARLEVWALPAYAPDLNPIEGVWSYLKCVMLPNLCAPTLNQLNQHLRRSLRLLRTQPSLLATYLRQPAIYL